MNGAKLDYRHRPAKNIERHIIVDACRAMFDALSISPRDAQYVGMGAYEFIDFQLFHRALGVDRMVSIERKDVTRHKFNRPFATVDILHGQIGDLIRGGKIDLQRPTILWLDYVERLSAKIVADVQDAVRRLSGPSMLIVTVSARNDDKVDGSAERLIDRVGRDWVQIDEGDDEAARGKGLVESQRLALTAAINDSMNERLTSDTTWKQVLNVSYADGVTMQTLAGMVLSADHGDPPADQMFRGRDYFTPGRSPLDLRVPVITSRERAHLDRQLPRHDGPLDAGDTGLDPADLDSYQRVYRWMHLAGLQSAQETTWTE
ncbi:hypothetical protein NS263_04080 [Curtobacterium oceanosedimentum]|uniref:Uncharacterized protein n=1 Tax=Curtobacterium oceanosedimentum TaxID=465820 RepID=A0ABR5S8N4_9MICO|nr:O-methyltransferase [Curtobacterium oceanosedimentum]KTR41663.1 hypothetical protein NS263_04080 [Curtobacterium oceanosedimentum]